MRQGRSYCTATTIGGEIFVVGGRVSVDDNNEELAEMERFDIEEMAWKDRAVAGQLGTRAFHAACAVKREA
ncbi:Kelch repeat-containing protein [Devosia indica]